MKTLFTFIFALFASVAIASPTVTVTPDPLGATVAPWHVHIDGLRPNESGIQLAITDTYHGGITYGGNSAQLNVLDPLTASAGGVIEFDAPYPLLGDGPHYLPYQPTEPTQFYLLVMKVQGSGQVKLRAVQVFTVTP